MGRALDELITRLTEIEIEADFIDFAAKLRPRLGDIMNWDARADILNLARQLMNTRDIHVESLNSALFVRAQAALERYLRSLVESCILHINASIKLESVPERIVRQNMILTGKVIAQIDTLKDHLNFDAISLIDNLSSCKASSTEYRLNHSVFSFGLTNTSPGSVEKHLDQIGIENWWDEIGASDEIKSYFMTKKTRESADKAKEQLKELTKWRNQIAHAGDAEPAISIESLKSSVAFLKLFSRELDRIVHLRMRGLSAQRR